CCNPPTTLVRPTLSLHDALPIFAPLTDSELVEPTIAQTLGAKGGLVEHVDEKRMLLLLDNFEHLLPAATKLSDLASACPSLHLLDRKSTRLNPVTSGSRMPSSA